MILGEVEESLRREFKRVADAAREALRTGRTGSWKVLGGELPTAQISVISGSMVDMSSRTLNITYPYMIRGASQSINTSSTVRGHEVGSWDREVGLFEETGPRMMAEILADCMVKLVSAGIEPWVLKDLVDLTVVKEVMET